GQGPVNNLCVVSNVVPEYAPPGRSLISVSVVGLPAATDGLEQSVRSQLTEWFGAQVSHWRLLRTHRIPWALPAQPAGFRDQPPGPPATVNGLWYCGDYQQTASIHGAMLSGRRTAVAVAESLIAR
ncbi:MAG: FAD-dependent oxidoreductase, partial [Planctomyces sp.]